MIYLKEANMEDMEKEYEFITNTPEDENGFTNPDSGCSLEDFKDKILPGLIKMSRGIDLPKGFVPQTSYFLWDEEKIVGLFRVRHYLNDYLKKHAGHIGYGIAPQYRGKGYGKELLRLLLIEANKIGLEKVLITIHSDNIASQKVALANGGVITEKTEERVYIWIREKNENKTIYHLYINFFIPFCEWNKNICACCTANAYR